MSLFFQRGAAVLLGALMLFLFFNGVELRFEFDDRPTQTVICHAPYSLIDFGGGHVSNNTLDVSYRHGDDEVSAGATDFETMQMEVGCQNRRAGVLAWLAVLAVPTSICAVHALRRRPYVHADPADPDAPIRGLAP